jgi:hypothetical protein
MTDTPASREQQAREVLAVVLENAGLPRLAAHARNGLDDPKVQMGEVVDAMLAFRDAPRPESASVEGDRANPNSTVFEDETFNPVELLIGGHVYLWQSKGGEWAQINMLPETLVRISRHVIATSRPTQVDERREAIARIIDFITKFYEPWGSWKTAWWEFEVSDAAFSADNALKHVQGLLAALPQHDGEAIRAAVLAEREACAKVADRFAEHNDGDDEDASDFDKGYAVASSSVATAIRSRPLPPIAEERDDG